MLQSLLHADAAPAPEPSLAADAPLAAAAPLAPNSPLAVLRRVFGFPGFRGSQEAVIDHVMAGGDALVLMPTGGGKSICYQIPALCRPGTAVVISPLIALMDDQVAAMRQAGVAAAALHSELPPEEARHVHRELVEQQLDLLYVSPERLLNNGTLDVLSRLELALFAIDEAHCVSQWGHEFRPEFRDLAKLGELFPHVPRVALTATADANTRQDILTALKMTGAEVFLASFHRPNLHLAAEPKVGETAQLLSFLARHKGACGIVYCGSRARTERVAAKLVEKGFPAVPFHAGLDPQQKREAAARFRSGEPLVVVATIAFGMGIDRPDVRFVVHLDMPDSPEAYYQQIGRAGRDGDPAETLLLYDGQDVARARHWLAQSAAPSAQKRVMRMRLEDMVAQTEAVGCRTQGLLACFGETMPEPCGHCDNCDDPPLTTDATLDARKLLSAVYRTDQIFGAVHTIAVLRGEKTDAVLRHGHDKLSVFGIGADHAVPYWRGIVRQLIALGALDVDTQGHGGLFLVEDKARPILRGDTQVLLRQTAPRKPAVQRSARGLAAAAGEFSQALFDALRSWRASEAKSQAVPPYVIFHDATLREIAAARPESLEELGQVKGVGASKLQRYGGRVLRLLRA